MKIPDRYLTEEELAARKEQEAQATQNRQNLAQARAARRQSNKQVRADRKAVKTAQKQLDKLDAQAAQTGQFNAADIDAATANLSKAQEAYQKSQTDLANKQEAVNTAKEPVKADNKQWWQNAGSDALNYMQGKAAEYSANGKTEDNIRKLSDNFYTGLNIWANTLGRDTKNPASAYLENQAAQHDQQAAQMDITAQQEAGIANRNYRVEADKDAISQAATKNAQAVQNLGASAGGGAAALKRTVQDADYNAHRTRQDDTRRTAQDFRDAAANTRQTATSERQAATALNQETQQMNRANDEIRWLSQTDPAFAETMRNIANTAAAASLYTTLNRGGI